MRRLETMTDKWLGDTFIHNNEEYKVIDRNLTFLITEKITGDKDGFTYYFVLKSK